MPDPEFYARGIEESFEQLRDAAKTAVQDPATSAGAKSVSSKAPTRKSAAKTAPVKKVPASKTAPRKPAAKSGAKPPAKRAKVAARPKPVPSETKAKTPK